MKIFNSIIKQIENKWGLEIISEIIFTIYVAGAFLIALRKPIIGSIILIFTGLIQIVFPKLNYYSRIPLDSSDSKKLILITRLGSLFILISGIGCLIYYIGLIPHIVFEYIYKHHYFFLCFILFFIGLYISFVVIKLEIDFEQYESNDKSKIENIQHSKISTRTYSESFARKLLYISGGCIILLIFAEKLPFVKDVPTVILNFFHNFILFFIGFLLVKYPAATGIKITNHYYLLKRFVGIMCMMIAIGSFISWL